MNRWSNSKFKYVDDEKVDAFLAEVVEVCRKHGMSLGHEDSQGAFLVENFRDSNSRWLMQAMENMD